MTIRFLALVALGFLFVSNAYAKDGASSFAQKKQGKIASASKEGKGIETSTNEADEQTGIPDIEPAAGAEKPDRKTSYPARDESGSLKEKLKLPRKY